MPRRNRPSNVRDTVERELKFSVDASFRMPPLALTGFPVIERGRTVVLTATYYDTDDLRLARSAVTLRRRTGGKDAGWHLKLSGDFDDPSMRVELQHPLTKSKTPPTELTDLVLALTRHAAINPLATMRTRRTPTVLRARDGQALEIVDDRVRVTDGPAAGLAYREIEVEALTSRADPAVVSGLLAEAGATPGAFPSKGTRALGVTQPLTPLVPPASRARPTDPAAFVVRNHLREHTRVLLRQDLRVRRDAPDAVHQFRVAARRLRSGLQSFAPLVEPLWARHLRNELGWIAGALGDARDAEVLEAHLFEAVRQLPGELDRAAGLVLVQDALEQRIEHATILRHEAMHSTRYLDLLDSLIEAAEIPHTNDLADQAAAEVLPGLVAARFARLARMAEQLPDELHGHDDDWHETRIAAKKARYVTEAVVPVFGTPARRFVKQLTKVTELLGEHQDCAIAADTVRSLVTRDTSAQAAATLGAVYAQQRARVQSIREEFLAEWPTISAKRWRRWLTTTDAPGDAAAS